MQAGITVFPAWINGERGAHPDARDRGLAFGDGLFETMRFGPSGVYLLEYHLRRLELGASRLRMSLDPSLLRAEIGTAVDCAREQFSEGVLKLILTRGVGHRGYKVSPGITSTRILMVSALPANPPEWSSEGVSVRFCDMRMGANPVLAGVKHLNRLEQVLARLEWDDPEIADGLLADARGRIVEGVSTNVFLVSGGRILTPVIDTCGVAGVMRQYIIDKAPDMVGQGVDVTSCEKGMFTGAREIFLCNSVVGVWPVARLAERKLQVGAVTRKIRDHVARLFGA
jgi:4-amino-4-deoxychorismate lyase